MGIKYITESFQILYSKGLWGSNTRLRLDIYHLHFTLCSTNIEILLYMWLLKKSILCCIKMDEQEVVLKRIIDVQYSMCLQYRLMWFNFKMWVTAFLLCLKIILRSLECICIIDAYNIFIKLSYSVCCLTLPRIS